MKFQPPKFSSADISTVIPVLEEGAYAGILHISVEKKVGDDYVPSIGVNPITKRENGENIPTGEYELSGMLSYRVELTSKKAISLLKQDKPQIFARQVKIFFNQENGNFELTNNPVIGSLTAMFLDSDGGDTFTELNDEIWERLKDLDIQVPEELSNIPNIEILYELGVFYDALFREWVLRLSGTKVKAIVSKVHPQNNVGGKYVTDKSTYINQLNQGNSWPIAKTGLLPYNEGDEFDLED